MAELVKKEVGPLAPNDVFSWEPFRAMRDLLRWDPFREMAPVLPAFEAFEAPKFFPKFDVKETKEAYIFKADLPGIKKEEIEITFVDNRLKISGKREFEKENKDDVFYTYERQYGAFARTFTLPEGADIEKANTEFIDGVLTLTVPKKPSVMPKKIAVT